MYLNTVTFGHNAFGIKSASYIFFGKTPDSLNIEEAAILVGLLRAPTKYSPILHPDNAIVRRNTVISQIEKYQKRLKRYKRSFSETVRAKNLDGLDDITGYAQRPYNEKLDGLQKLIADGRFLNSGDGGSTIISEGVRGSGSASASARSRT
jgi:hypothetical protein